MSAFSANESESSVVPTTAQYVSTQWSTARTPVLNQVVCGVVDATSCGSRTISCGPRRGAWKECLRRVWSLVAPAKFEYSPAERVVGTEMIGTDEGRGSFAGRSWFGPMQRVSRSSNVLALFARACKCQFRFQDICASVHTNETTFAPSVSVPPPSVSIRSAEHSRASAVISRTSDHRVWLFMPIRRPTIEILSLSKA